MTNDLRGKWDPTERPPWAWIGVYFIGILTGACLFVPPSTPPRDYLDAYQAGVQSVRHDLSMIDPQEPVGCALDATEIEHNEEPIR